LPHRDPVPGLRRRVALPLPVGGGRLRGRVVRLAAGGVTRGRLLGIAGVFSHPGRGVRVRLAERGVSVGVNVPENVVLTSLVRIANWVRVNSLWPMPFATACSAIELMATGASRHDLAPFR